MRIFRTMDVRRSHPTARSRSPSTGEQSLRLWQVRAVIATQLERTLDDVLPDSRLAEDLGADFLGITSVMLGIEEAFDIDIQPDDVAALIRVGDVVAYVQRALSARAA